MEQMQEQNRATIEAVTALGTSLRRDMSEMERRLTLRIEVLEAAVRQNSEDIRKNSEDIRKNSEDIQQLKAQLAELTNVVRGKADQTALQQLEARVGRLEERVGI